MADPTPLAASLGVYALPQRLRGVTLVPKRTERHESPEDVAGRVATARGYRKAQWDRLVPPIWRDASLTALTAAQNPAGDVAGWWAGGHLNLYLWSPEPGVGKTYAAYAVAADAAVEHGASVEAWTAAELLAGLRPGGDPALMERVKTADLLLMDDFGKEASDKAWVCEQWHSIIDKRLSYRRRTIVTTNLDGPTLGARYDPALVDRLTDDAVIVRVTGESRRKPAKW